MYQTSTLFLQGQGACNFETGLKEISVFPSEILVFKKNLYLADLFLYGKKLYLKSRLERISRANFKHAKLIGREIGKVPVISSRTL